MTNDQQDSWDGGPIFECGPACSCHLQDCANRVTQQPVDVAMQVEASQKVSFMSCERKLERVASRHLRLLVHVMCISKEMCRSEEDWQCCLLHSLCDPPPPRGAISLFSVLQHAHPISEVQASLAHGSCGLHL